MSQRRTVDRFGFPLSIAIDFRRRMFGFEQTSGNWTAREKLNLRATRYLIDGEPDEALRALHLGPLSSDAELRNAAVAYDLMGDSKRADEVRKALRPNQLADLPHQDRPSNQVNIVIPFATDTGGMRVQVDIALALAAAGYDVHVFQLRSNDLLFDATVASSFKRITAVSNHAELTRELAQTQAAMTMVGCWVDYLPAVTANCGPVIGFSGGEPTLNETSKLDSRFLRYRHAAHQLPVHLLTCSRFIQQVYDTEFQRRSTYIPVALDRRAFQAGSRKSSTPFRVLLVARDGLEDKGLGYAIPALEDLRRQGFHLEIVWITPEAPTIFINVDCELHVNPAKADLYRIIASCHSLVYPPIIDGLGLPPLEAMAAGVAVIVTLSGGPDEFAHDGSNCLVIEKESVRSIQDAVKRLYGNRDLLERLTTEGRDTAVTYHPDSVRSRLLKYFEEIGHRRLYFDPPASLHGPDSMALPQRLS